MSKKPAKEDIEEKQQEAGPDGAPVEDSEPSDDDWPDDNEDTESSGKEESLGHVDVLNKTAADLRLDPSKQHHENIYDILMKQDEITWQSLIKELIKSEQMDPWDINISQLTKMFIKTIKKLKELNLNISGKVLLCAALLLRIKSSKLIGDDLLEFDRLLASGENPDELYQGEEYVEGQLNQLGMTLGKEHMHLIPKTPQPRKRKVSVYDLIDALAVALNVKRRRILNQIQVRTAMGLPEKKMDLSELMDDLYKIVSEQLASGQATVAFSNLVPGESKHDKIYTFVPLLHLTNARKVDLAQNEHFGEIWVSLAKKGQKPGEKEDPGYEEDDGKVPVKKKTAKKRKKKEEKQEEAVEDSPKEKEELTEPVQENPEPESPEPERAVEENKTPAPPEEDPAPQAPAS
ncbi:segregation/condensation protein A [Candidatus Woesearchaeota archaeon]|nr:segregation/condensation protein A [Candidatus Woesearchaeota archaeon]